MANLNLENDTKNNRYYACLRRNGADRLEILWLDREQECIVCGNPVDRDTEQRLKRWFSMALEGCRPSTFDLGDDFDGRYYLSAVAVNGSSIELRLSDKDSGRTKVRHKLLKSKGAAKFLGFLCPTENSSTPSRPATALPVPSFGLNVS